SGFGLGARTFCRALVLGWALVAAPAQAATFIVNSAGDTPDANVGDGTCADAGRFCTLPAAIQEANSTPALDTIRFNSPPAGAHTIVIGSALPDITSPVKINGTTQPGWVNAPPYSPVIEMDGSSFVGGSGLTLNNGSSGSTIRGLAIHG